MATLLTPATTWIEILTLITLLAPLTAALIAFSISSRYAWVTAIITPLLLLGGFIAATLLFFDVWNAGPSVVTTTWFTVAGRNISAGIYLDNLSAIMVLIILAISFLVHLYSSGYMAADTALKRYFAMLGFFTFAMIGLVLADNLLLMFVFWELVGFSSYMLIGHWTEQEDAASASKKAFVMNRIGDLGFLIGLLIIWSNTGTFALSQLSEATETFSWQTFASLCLLWGAIGKSAQFPLLTWLPDAMAGPTPVSALIHAATMVAAGVFLLARTYLLFTPETLNIVVIIGTITTLLGGISALYQYTIKKVLAYSTISQLGLMVIAIGVGAQNAFVIHLFTHAFFKAGLFLAAGSVIHSLDQALHTADENINIQDIRNLGGLRKFLPVSFLVFVICGASLAGIPLFSGFLSKEAIIQQTLNWAGNEVTWRWFIVGALFLSSFITMLYIFRLIWFVFMNDTISSRWKKFTITEAPVVMRIPMIILALCSLWLIVSPNPLHISGWFFQSDHVSLTLSVISTAWVGSALITGYFFYKNRSAEYPRSQIKNIFHAAFYLDKIYQQVVLKPVNKLSLFAETLDLRLIDRAIHFAVYSQATTAHFVGWVDRAFIDGTVRGLARIAKGIGQLTRSFQGGKIQHYLFWSILGLILLLLFMNS